MYWKIQINPGTSSITRLLDDKITRLLGARHVRRPLTLAIYTRAQPDRGSSLVACGT